MPLICVNLTVNGVVVHNPKLNGALFLIGLALNTVLLLPMKKLKGVTGKEIPLLEPIILVLYCAGIAIGGIQCGGDGTVADTVGTDNFGYSRQFRCITDDLLDGIATELVAKSRSIHRTK